MIHILYTFLSKEFYDTALTEQLNYFPIEYRNKIKNYKRWQDQQASVLGRILLMRGLKDYYELEIDGSDILIDDDGKPYLNKYSIKFNISHSGELVVCTFSKTQTVGVDIEQMKDIQIEDFYYQMTDNESRIIRNSSDKTQAFYHYWTQKEAVLKANGKGLSVPLKSFEIIGNKTQLYKEEWCISKLNIHPEYSCHIASKRKSNYVIYHVNHSEIGNSTKKV